MSNCLELLLTPGLAAGLAKGDGEAAGGPGKNVSGAEKEASSEECHRSGGKAWETKKSTSNVTLVPKST